MKFISFFFVLFFFQKTAEIPSIENYKLDTFEFDDINMSDLETCMASMRMYMDLDLLHRFNVPHKVSLIFNVKVVLLMLFSLTSSTCDSQSERLDTVCSHLINLLPKRQNCRKIRVEECIFCLLYTSPSPRDS